MISLSPVKFESFKPLFTNWLLRLSLIIVFSIYIGLNSCYSQPKIHTILILPRGFVFEPLTFDPIQCQSGASILKLFRSDKQNGKIYVPVDLGFQQSFVRYQKNDGPALELGMGASAFTQFEFINHNPDKFQGQIINSDFKAAGFLNISLHKVVFRLQLFHESSHLSDYYILNKNITSPNDGSRTYEQLDFTGAIRKGKMNYYAGLGTVISKYSYRKRFSAETGFDYEIPILRKKNFRFVSGSDIKFFQENKYVPDIRLGAGIGVGILSEIHWNIFLEYFSGHIPYSTLDYGQIAWFGVSTVIVPVSIVK